MLKTEKKLLLRMLELSIGGLIENEICSYCIIKCDKDERCKNADLCSDLIFNGLKKTAQEEVRKGIKRSQMILSEEHQQIIDCVMNGMTNIEISEVMGYSPASVKRRLREIYKIHNVNTRIQLIKKVVCSITCRKPRTKKRFR